MFKSVKDRIRQWLVGTQQYTGTDNVYITKNGFWVTFPYIISTLLSAAQVVAFANFLPKETYGTYKFILSATSIFGFLTLTGMNTAVTQMTAQGVEGVLAWSVRLQLKFNMIYAAAAAIVAGYYVVHHDLTIACGVLIIGISFPLSAALNTYGAYLSGKKNFRLGSQYGVISNIFSSLALLGAIVFSGNILVIVLGYSLGSLLPALFFYLRTSRATPVASMTQEQKYEVARYGGHLSIINILSTIGQYIDKILLFHATGAVQLAVYSLAQAIPNRVEGYFKSWTSILLPKLSSRTTKEIETVFYARLAQGFAIGVITAGIYWVCAPIVFHLLLPKYLEGIAYSRVMMFAFVFTMPAAYTSSIFKSQRILPVIYASSIVGNIVLITLYAILGTTWGVWGLIWAQIIAQALGVGFNCILWEWKVKPVRAVQ